MDENAVKKAKFYALKVINFRPRSVEELTEKLKTKGFAGDIIEAVTSEFAKNGLLNDSKFSKLWVEGRMSTRPKGGAVLRRELKSKGVSEQVIAKVLEDSKKDHNEYEIVKRLADERMSHLKDLDNKTAKRRLFGFLKRRGFDFETIMKVIGEEFK